jgi:hypothetical protein
VLVRSGLVRHQEQNHRRSHKRWQRDAPMQLWQIDIMGGVLLADGRECKPVTGIDDHSRFVVISQVIADRSSRAVCQAFTDAMNRYGVPSEVLTDNGKQFTGRFTKPFPAEVMSSGSAGRTAVQAGADRRADRRYGVLRGGPAVTTAGGAVMPRQMSGGASR